MTGTSRPMRDNLLPKLLIGAGLLLLGYLAIRFVVAAIAWMLIAIIAVVLLWFGARMLADRIPDE